MWVLVLTASLLIQSIVGNLEIESSDTRKLSGFEFAGQRNPEIRSKYESDVSKTWEDSLREQNEMELSIENKRQKILNKKSKSSGTTRTRLAQISKRSDFEPKASWIYAAFENKIPSNEEWSQEKRKAFSPWGGKRADLYQLGTAIRRPIRMPFNSWGGKRGRQIGEEDGSLREKKSKDLPARDEHRLLVEGYGVKRLSEDNRAGWKVPFNSWGGKRSQQTDLDRRLMFTADNNDEPTPITDKFTEVENAEVNMEEKRAPQLKNSKGLVRFNSWGGKRSQPDYRVSSTMHNEIGTDYEGQNEVDDTDWSVATPEKKSEVGQFHRAGFDPWAGKRIEGIHEFHLVDDYSGIPADSASGRKIFFPWGG